MASTAVRISVDLHGVPETMLWPLWNRAVESRRRSPLIRDPIAERLTDSIDYDFEASFGRPTLFHPVRARYGDQLIEEYIRSRQRPVVVALGEGLDTAYWRIADPSVRWLSVDLPKAIELRQRLLPSAPECLLCASSAIGLEWFDAIPAGDPPFISAAGLLMYFQEHEVRALLTRISERLPGSTLFFDTIPASFAGSKIEKLKITKTYELPTMPWGIALDDIAAFVSEVPGVRLRAVTGYPELCGHRMLLYRALSYIRPVRRRFAPGLVVLDA
ncbi:MAG: class I SAM-dependent methyltransferase [Pseudomonadota bacterium]